MRGAATARRCRGHTADEPNLLTTLCMYVQRGGEREQHDSATDSEKKGGRSGQGRRRHGLWLFSRGRGAAGWSPGSAAGSGVTTEGAAVQCEEPGRLHPIVPPHINAKLIAT